MASTNVLLVTVLLFLSFADVSNSYSFWNFRRLASSDVVAPGPKSVGNETGSPLPSPVAGAIAKQTAPAPQNSKGKQTIDKDKQLATVNTTISSANTTTSAPPPVDSNATTLSPPEKLTTSAPPAKNATLAPAPPPVDDGKGRNKSEGKSKEKGDTKENVPPAVIHESCNGKEKCNDMKSMTACIQNFDEASKALVLLIENEGEKGLKVNVGVATATVDVPEHQNKKVNFPLKSGTSNTIILNAGNGDCILQLSPSISKGNILQWLPSYNEMMTPIYGAYLLLALTLIAGGIWACCKFGSSRRHGEIPYQELEMGNTESSAVNVETDGWDDGWDEDWDEENAIKSPSTSRAAGISANGLNSRAANRDGWEDWDE